MLILLLCNANVVLAQNGDRLRISLLTCTPGEELYSTFGHSAIRVIDSNSVTDVVYNYGTFDFDDPNFYSKFVRGKLLYYVNAEQFSDFMLAYQYENRGVTEQVLALSAEEKIALQNALNTNLLPQNRFYKYDFCLDNCTTRLRDKIEGFKQPPLQHTAVMPADYTFRDAIHFYLNKNKKHWSKFGIDLLLGYPLDARMTAKQQQFLPDNLMLALDNNTTKIVAAKQVILPQIPMEKKDGFTPMMAMVLAAFSIFVLSFAKNKFIKTVFEALQFLLVFFSGLLGLLLVFMWFGTDHLMTKQNFNLLWALPTNAIFAFYLNKTSALAKKYFTTTFFIHLFTAVFFFILPQAINAAVAPIVLALAWASYLQMRSK